MAWLARMAAWWMLVGGVPLMLLHVAKLLLGHFQVGDAKGITMSAGFIAIGWAVEIRAGAEIRRQAAARRAARGFEVVSPADPPRQP